MDRKPNNYYKKASRVTQAVTIPECLGAVKVGTNVSGLMQAVTVGPVRNSLFSKVFNSPRGYLAAVGWDNSHQLISHFFYLFPLPVRIFALACLASAFSYLQ